MKILLDTHVLIWFLTDNKLLTKSASEIILSPENEIFYSVISIFEIDLKRQNHPEDMPFDGEQVLRYCDELEFLPLPLNMQHALAVKNLKRPENLPPHKDPFDRLMLAQAIAENMIFMTHDKRIAEYSSQNIYKV